MHAEKRNSEPENNFRLLIVDDDPLILSELVDTVEHSDFFVSCAGNGLEALACIDRDGPPDILLTDIMMPEMDGLELVSGLLAADTAGRHCAVIFTSGYDSVSHVASALRLNAVDYIEKPMSRIRVREAIDTARQNLLLIRENEDKQRRLLTEMKTVRDHADALIENFAAPEPICAPFQLAKKDTSAQLAKKDTSAQEDNASVQFYGDYLASIRQMESAKNGIVGAVAGDAAIWSMLIELLRSHISNENVTVTNLCYVANCPQTSALRKIEQMEMAGLVERRLDDGDRRRRVVTLTDEGIERISSYLSSVSRYLR